jgi:presenilin-like A22 family membrane protease
MFFITQLIGLAVINAYNQPVQVFNETTQEYEEKNATLPYGMEPPEVKEERDFWKMLPTFLISMAIAIALIFFLMTIKAALFLRIWFFIVVVLALGLSINAFFLMFGISASYVPFAIFIVSLPLAYFKVFKQNILVHNLTELIIYPGIAAVFVPILNIWTVSILLIIISIYDIYAVWHAGFMQKMAKFQINKLKFFTGFFVPYIGKKERQELKKAKKSEKNKNKKIKVNLAILGGGDVIFPIITAGVVLVSLQSVLAALLVSVFATLSLLFLFLLSEKGKFYPAMPFISAGCFIGVFLAYLLF